MHAGVSSTINRSQGQNPSTKFFRLAQLRKLRRCEQVAAVCFRARGSGIEFLLVQTGKGRWIFPKGGAEPGLTHAQAAALEAFEEAGVHGRIEEASFTRYVRRKRDGSRNLPARKSADRKIAVNAHLCEVLRLSSPQESHRNRTWFSIEDAKQSLRDGRATGDGAEFARVIDRAVERIQRPRGSTDIVYQPRKARLQQARPQRYAIPRDALQKVQFAFAEGYGRVEEASSML